MASKTDWSALGRLIAGRREALGLSGRAAEVAGGPSEATWRRIEAGHSVRPPMLYRICLTLGVEEDEAAGWFERVGLTFDAAGYERPEAYDRLIASLKAVKTGAEQALAAAVQLEVESRGPK